MPLTPFNLTENPAEKSAQHTNFPTLTLKGLVIEDFDISHFDRKSSGKICPTCKFPNFDSKRPSSRNLTPFILTENPAEKSAQHVNFPTLTLKDLVIGIRHLSF